MIATIFDTIFSIEASPANILLVGALFLFLSILAGKAGYKMGIPILLLFLGVGMALGEDGLGFQFSDPHIAQFIGLIALSIILFSGGMDTKFQEIKPIWARGLLLSTIGVLLTAITTGAFIFAISKMIGGRFELTLWESLLIASVMSSTDSASVFSLLRSKGLNLDRNLRATLELESGSNDPMAYMLTIFFIQLIQNGSTDIKTALFQFITQLSLGAIFGILCGKITVQILNKINIDNTAMYSILLLASILFTFAITDKFWGNGYLAVYLAGLIVGNSKFAHRKTVATFFDSFAWLWQIVMFLTLGLLVNPNELLDIAFFGFAIAVFMTIFGRPLSVFLTLIPFKMNLLEKSYISWVGLKGAVPIIFATYPLIAGIDKANMMFNIVFFITIISLLFQGTSVGFLANKFGLIKKKTFDGNEFGLEFSEDVKSTMAEIEIPESALVDKNRLMDMKFPKNTLVVMIKRNGNFFIPQGNTSLLKGDKLLVISDNKDELEELYKNFNIEILP